MPYEEADVFSAGVNHQAWILGWQHQGRDLYPALDAAIAADPELLRRVRVDMYRRLGYYPTETSEHSSEYVPWYLRHAAEIERLRIPVDDYVGISAGNLAEYAAVRDALAAGRDPEPREEEDAAEYAPQVIHSLATGTLRTIQVTTANTGLITNLPAGAGVEVPATLDRRGVHPHHVGALPPQLAALNRSFLNVVDLTVAAALEGDPRHVRHAAMADPATAAALTVDEIWTLCDAMVAAHGDALATRATRLADNRDRPAGRRVTPTRTCWCRARLEPPPAGQAETLVDSGTLPSAGRRRSWRTARRCSDCRPRSRRWSAVTPPATSCSTPWPRPGSTSATCVRHESLPTALTVCLNRPDGDRAILTAPGCLPSFGPSEQVPAVETRHVHAASYFLQPRLAAGLPGVLEGFRRAGASTSLDTNDDPAGEWSLAPGLLAACDLLLPNEAEA